MKETPVTAQHGRYSFRRLKSRSKDLILHRTVKKSKLYRYQKLFVESFYDKRYFGLQDVCRELDLSAKAVIALTSKDGLFPCFDIKITEVKQYYREYWKFRLVVDAYKYVKEMRLFEGTYSKKGKNAVREHFYYYWNSHEEEYIRRYKDYVF